MLQTLAKPHIGDIAPGFKLLSMQGEVIDLRADNRAGKPSLLIFLPAGQNMAQLSAFVESAQEFSKLQATIYVIARDRGQLENARVGITALPDPEGKVMAAFGLQNEIKVFVIAPNRHIAGIYPGMDCLPEVKSKIQAIAEHYQSAQLTNHPPVLLIPNILSSEECRHLMNIYAMQGNIFVEPGHGPSNHTGDYKMRIPDYGRRDRIDHWIKQSDTNKYIDERLGRRLFPEILKAFQYRITKREDYRIGCYEGERGGELHGHRDNTSPRVAHRRFACSINLNTEDFEGGELRFPEFGNHLYRPPTGAAIVFSSSLLHEPLHVTAGRRFVLLAFLYGDH